VKRLLKSISIKKLIWLHVITLILFILLLGISGFTSHKHKHYFKASLGIDKTPEISWEQYVDLVLDQEISQQGLGAVNNGNDLTVLIWDDRRWAPSRTSYSRNNPPSYKMRFIEEYEGEISTKIDEFNTELYKAIINEKDIYNSNNRWEHKREILTQSQVEKLWRESSYHSFEDYLISFANQAYISDRVVVKGSIMELDLPFLHHKSEWSDSYKIYTTCIFCNDCFLGIKKNRYCESDNLIIKLFVFQILVYILYFLWIRIRRYFKK